ncbi:hypothetical protein KL911_004688 [Ogataea haglerorum]|uniref:uncharacterized protein n=1 Tax=Ogataea haglerorum TaxID=1937702 RepID=UPI001C89343A|nr:uncharacterized protein KL911_004688 [Ogataea haglerorum]KAG7750809.1 hypothetical protein KL911_004688 [Ogataea haglerorum]
MSLVYDSADPELPNLPESAHWSDSDYPSDDGSGPSAESVPFSSGTDQLDITQKSDSDSPPAVSQPTQEHQKAAGPHVKVPKSSYRRKHKARSRKYAGSGTKKERTGWEPGIDVRTTNVVMNTPGSWVVVTDYSPDRYRVTHYEVVSETGADDDALDLQLLYAEGGHELDPQAVEAQLKEYRKRAAQTQLAFERGVKTRPLWSHVRWINVNGLSWEAISTIGKHYNLHRLSIEDMIDIPQRTKVDLYPNHLFTVLPLIKVVRTNRPRDAAGNRHASADDSKSLNSRASSLNTVDMTLSERISDERKMRKLSDLDFSSFGEERKKSRKMRNLEIRRPLKSKGLAVGIEQVSIFLTDDNTVITFFEHSAGDITRAILARLAARDTLLRTSDEASILLHSILDAIVDLVYPVTSAYGQRLNEIELDILTNPTISHTQELHLMINELANLKSRITPACNLIHQMREVTNFRKFMSENSVLYMNDIYDHLVSYVDDIESMSRTIENLVNLIFNTLSVETNNSMKQLSLVTVVFLPLSFWAGYFGMNFEKFGNLKEGVGFYWKVTIPFTCVLILLVMWRDIFKKANYSRKYVARIMADIAIERAEKERKLRRRKSLA